jgi:hypothetical protein
MMGCVWATLWTQLWRPADEPEYFECQPLVESKGTTDTQDEEVRRYI